MTLTFRKVALQAELSSAQTACRFPLYIRVFAGCARLPEISYMSLRFRPSRCLRGGTPLLPSGQLCHDKGGA